VTIRRSLLLTPFLAGCYSYTAIAPAAAPAGSEVRAHISGAALDRVGPLLGAYDRRDLVGSVVANHDGDMVLDVELGTMPNVRETLGPLHRQVPLAPGDVVSLEQRKLDVVRTSVLVGGIAAGIGVGVAAALHSRGSSEEGRGPTEPPPITRIPIRIWGISF
jgi:hypothetical protein